MYERLAPGYGGIAYGLSIDGLTVGDTVRAPDTYISAPLAPKVFSPKIAVTQAQQSSNVNAVVQPVDGELGVTPATNQVPTDSAVTPGKLMFGFAVLIGVLILSAGAVKR